MALTWSKLRRHHGAGRSLRLRDCANDWAVAQDGVKRAEIDDYITNKVQFAARKCAPFLRIVREEQATTIEPKRYVMVYGSYLDDPRIAAALTGNERFPVKGADVLRLEDPKKVVFYWSELGMPVYRIESVDEYYERYNYVKRDELGRGRVYHWEELPYQPRGGTAAAKHGEGRKVPDIPLHTDKHWEGAPDEFECLAHVAARAVNSKQGRIAWLEARTNMREERAGEELVQFTLAQCFGLVVRRTDKQYAYANDNIPERDRLLGEFCDEAFERFRGAKLAIREWLTESIAAREEGFVKKRDREGVKALLGQHKEAVGKLRLQLEGKEQSFVEREYHAVDLALQALLDKM